MNAPRTIEFRFTPTSRAQMALWIEKEDGTFLKTVGLTQAVSFRGIGNRPGAAQMNGGFHWPYGRREGVLPIWAHRRAAAPGAAQFKRVIFQDRTSEGDASRTSNDSTAESYFCLSFTTAKSQKSALDAVTCASAFSSDKGRYLLSKDVDASYSEPAVVGGLGMMRPLDTVSLYPPRRDITKCTLPGCVDTPDVTTYSDDARQVMSDIDSITMATPPEQVEQSVFFNVPDDWAAGKYAAWIEVNKEGDYNDTFNDQTYPTPIAPAGTWDIWAMTYGYPYRGQPSVVFRVPFTLSALDDSAPPPPPSKAVVPTYFGDVDGFGSSGGDLHPFVAGIITDNPSGETSGSGADRLNLISPHDYRVQVTVARCPPVDVPPDAPTNVAAIPDPDPKHSHQWGRLHFVVPESPHPITRYEVRLSDHQIFPTVPDSFTQALPAGAATIENAMLMVRTSDAPGIGVDVEFGGMQPLTHYYVAIRAWDSCKAGPYVVTELTTTRINFTKLSGCFIATAAYGSAMEPQVGALRVVRDGLRSRSSLFATATDLYYRSGPAAAAVIARSDVARAVVRTLLGPAVEMARAVTPFLSRSPVPSSSPMDRFANP